MICLIGAVVAAADAVPGPVHGPNLQRPGPRVAAAPNRRNPSKSFATGYVEMHCFLCVFLLSGAIDEQNHVPSHARNRRGKMCALAPDQNQQLKMAMVLSKFAV